MRQIRERLAELASAFAAEVVAAIRSAPLEELLAQVQSHRVTVREREEVGKSTDGIDPNPRRGIRLQRRSSADIAMAVESIVSLLRLNKQGLRSEQIRSELKMQPNEMPRVLKEGLSTRVLRARGQKRARVYFLA
jgi:hypothetical protein